MRTTHQTLKQTRKQRRTAYLQNKVRTDQYRGWKEGLSAKEIRTRNKEHRKSMLKKDFTMLGMFAVSFALFVVIVPLLFGGV